MPYFLKWIPGDGAEVMDTGVAYARPADAMDFACLLLARTLRNIWIEDGHGATVIGIAQITQHCRTRSAAPPHLLKKAGPIAGGGGRDGVSDTEAAGREPAT
jgi:hypothetical protein